MPVSLLLIPFSRDSLHCCCGLFVYVLLAMVWEGGLNIELFSRVFFAVIFFFVTAFLCDLFVLYFSAVVGVFILYSEYISQLM